MPTYLSQIKENEWAECLIQDVEKWAKKVVQPLQYVEGPGLCPPYHKKNIEN